jgi:hypothetical protein
MFLLFAVRKAKEAAVLQSIERRARGHSHSFGQSRSRLTGWSDR